MFDCDNKWEIWAETCSLGHV